MSNKKEETFFQDDMPGNICFGCGSENEQGLQIKSKWEGDESVCFWNSKEMYQGWPGVLCGGITASLIDCHCMNTATAYAYKLEGREMGSFPVYKYATGTLNIKYLKPVSNDHPIEIRAKIVEVKNRKTVLHCEVFTQGIKAAEAEVIGIRVYDSSKITDGAFSQ